MKIDSSCCIVCVATGNYSKGLNRLEKSLKGNNYKGDILFFTDSLPKDSPMHEESPWGFKPFAIREAISKGYKKVLWLDSNMVCIRNPKKIFKKIQNDGYYTMCSYSNTLGEWCSDIVLNNLGLEREKAFSLFEVSPQCLGINADNDVAISFLEEWCKYALDGISFRGLPKEYPLEMTKTNKDNNLSSDNRVKGHRHDQTIATYLMWKYAFKRSYCEVKNIQAGTNYSKAISYNVEFVQNRDITGETYLETVTKWLNSKGLKKIVFILLSFVDVIKRRSFYIKNEKKIKRNYIGL